MIRMVPPLAGIDLRDYGWGFPVTGWKVDSLKMILVRIKTDAYILIVRVSFILRRYRDGKRSCLRCEH